jgi:hypothetical protein
MYGLARPPRQIRSPQVAEPLGDLEHDPPGDFRAAFAAGSAPVHVGSEFQRTPKKHIDVRRAGQPLPHRPGTVSPVDGDRYDRRATRQGEGTDAGSRGADQSGYRSAPLGEYPAGRTRSQLAQEPPVRRRSSRVFGHRHAAKQAH